MRENRGISTAIAVVTLLFLAAMPFLMPTAIWIVLSVYAIVKGAGSAPDHPNAVAVVLSIVGIVTVSTLAIAAAIALLGRAMTPKRRRRGDQVATLDA